MNIMSALTTILQPVNMLLYALRCTGERVSYFGMGLSDGVELGLEGGSLAGVVCQLSFGVGSLLLSSSQPAAQACLAPLQAVHPLPGPPYTSSYT